MKRAGNAARYVFLFLMCALLVCQLFLGSARPTSANPGTLLWDIVDTPANGLASNIIVTQSEINALAMGSDEITFYAVDIRNNRLYKSTDAGVTWPDNVTPVAAGQTVWNVAVAPDDVDFIVAITGGSGVAGGPKAIFISTDGGQNWEYPSQQPALVANELISYVAISLLYDGSNRYIAIGTRDGNGAGIGRVFTMKAPGYSGWISQTVAPSLNWVPGDVVALRFSPNYPSDLTMVVIFASPAGFFHNLGTHDVSANRTTWRSGLGFPVRMRASDNRSPTHAQIITADLELPSDFSGSDPGTMRRCFVSYDARDGGLYFSGIFRIDNRVAYQLKYQTSVIPATPQHRISSISYYGTYSEGNLIAAETTTAATRGLVDIWVCPNSTSPFTPEWRLCSNMKSPTGGGNTAAGRANAIVAWSVSGTATYCATSSADLSAGGTSPVIPNNRWPGGLWNTASLDESAFSVSVDGGQIWNQISLIDTEVTYLADVAVFEATEDSQQYKVLYLASINDVPGPDLRFDSIWRSTSDPLGQKWERILCTLTTNNDSILRGNPRIINKIDRSRVIVFADRGTDTMYYSSNEGQTWIPLYHGYPTTDFTLASDLEMYILTEQFVSKGTLQTTWTWGSKVPTLMATAHTITTPLENPENKDGVVEDWVIVGSSLIGEVAYADFSKALVDFKPPLDQRKRLPTQGDAHVLADEEFQRNYTIYVASGNVNNGKIFRWTIGKSTQWDELQPPNNDFRGLEQRQGALYGAFDIPLPPHAGVDRALEPRRPVPPPPEWDDLTTNYNQTIYNPVLFTREPSALRISSRIDNNLWAIDNRPFNWGNRQGCLWNYVDTLVRNGPWSTSPASNDVIPVDPATGRANEVNFAWRSLSLASGYELQIAKDQDFVMRVLMNENIVPLNQLGPGWVLQPGFLDASHKYFWRVRARQATTGEIIRSPWSATMFFTVMAGFPVESKHLGPTLLKPPNQCRTCSSTPTFSWSPMFQTTQYEFVLARDAELSQVIETAKVNTTAYQYQETLEQGTYYWRVKAIKPMLSEPSPIGCFTVSESEKTTTLLGVQIAKPTSELLWVGLSLYALFMALMLMFIMKTRFRR